MSDIPRRSTARAARLASLPLGIAGRTAWAVGKRVGGKPAEMVAAEVQARTAEQLFTVLGELKGGAMKVGQAMSIMEAAFPEDLAAPYRATLTKLQEAAPPLPAATVHAVLAEQLGPRWRTSKFIEFEDRPAAAASIGQVHRAVWRDGRQVAVKIQYPGAAQALINDLKQLNRVARLAGSIIPGLDVKPVTEEIMSRMREELDYDLEARHQRAFGRAYRNEPDVVIPEVLVHSERVIVTEWVDGRPLSDIIANGTQAERDLAARLYITFLISGPEHAGLLHADPHPGNFRITHDGRLAVFDYGAVNRLDGGLPPAIGRLLSAAFAGDAQAVEAGLRGEGYIRPGISIDPDELLDYLLPFLEPLMVDRFQFSRGWLRGLAARVHDPRKPQWMIGLKLNLPPEYVLIQRVWLGGIGVLCQIGGEIEARRIVAEHVPGVVLP